MTARTLFWAVAFSMPVAAAAVMTHSLQRERTALQARIAQLNAGILRRQDSLREANENLKVLADQAAAMKGAIDRFEQALPPWERRMLAVKAAAVRLAADAGVAAKAKSAVPLVLQHSVKQPYFVELLGDPAYARAVLGLMKQQVETEYGVFLANCKLSPAAEDKLEDLLSQWYLARVETDSLMGVTSDSADRTAAEKPTLQDINHDIRSDFGPQLAKQLQTYNGQLQFYGVADAMTTRLSSGATPFTPDQAQQLVGTLYQTLGKEPGRFHWMMTDSVIEQAQGFLAPPQIAVMRQIQQEQQVMVQTRDARDAALSAP